MNVEQKHILKVWIAAALWMGLIALESTKYFGASETSRILYPIFHFLFGLTWEQFRPWHHIIRKTGHFVGFFTLSLLQFRAWKATLRQHREAEWMALWAALALLVSVVVASLDEWHQTYLPNRTGTVSDVILDSTAAIVAQIVVFLYIRNKFRESRVEELVLRGD